MRHWIEQGLGLLMVPGMYVKLPNFLCSIMYACKTELKNKIKMITSKNVANTYD